MSDVCVADTRGISRDAQAAGFCGNCELSIAREMAGTDKFQNGEETATAYRKTAVLSR
jgi:hypothetical protein